MAREIANGQAPFLRRADQLQCARVVDRVPVERVWLVDHARSRLDRPPAQVGVVACRFPKGLVEAAQLLEQRAWIGDVARLEPRPWACCRLRAREGGELVKLAWIGLGASLDHRG